MGLFKKDGILDETAVLNALRVVKDPDLGKDVVSLGFIKDLKIDGGKVSFNLRYSLNGRDDSLSRRINNPVEVKAAF